MSRSIKVIHRTFIASSHRSRNIRISKIRVVEIVGQGHGVQH